MSETKSKKKVKRDKMPELLAEDVIDVQFAREELTNLINLLSVISATFDALAKESLKNNQTEVFERLSERANISADYANKFATLANMGEVQSRELH